MMFCPKCGGSVTRADRYCRLCGVDLPSHSSGAENRLVTILCTDLCGYSPLAERLDPEDLRECMARIMGEVTTAITRYGGTIEKYIGDAVVAIFGLHRVKEDDPVRAVLAARQAHRAVEHIDLPRGLRPPAPLRLHTGINTGEVIVDFNVSAASPHGTLGRPINIASRLCDLASEGEILIGEALVSTVMRYFNIEWKGSRMFKGIQTPVHVYSVLDEKKTPVAVHREGGLTSQLVGREHELSILLSGARGIAAKRKGVICINGEAGVGKSRLIGEFRDRLGTGSSFLMASCVDHAGSIPYFPLYKLIPPAMELVGLGGKVKENSWSTPGGAEHADHVRCLITVFGGSQAGGHGPRRIIRERLIDAVHWLFREVSSRMPLVVCIEDIHWADQSTLDLIAYLVNSWGQESPWLMVFSHRPHWVPGFAATRINLKDLSQEDVGRMLSSMLDVPSVPDEMVLSMTHATGGNPFFLEEMVNYLLEKGAGVTLQGREATPWEIPASLHGLIASRIDRLDASSRRILQEASLIGRTFHEGLLASVSSQALALEEGLDSLVRHGFIHQEGAGEYIFRHDIIRDVAGRSLLKKERRAIHGQIGRALEGSTCPVEGSVSGVLAYHFTRAQEYEKAVQCCLDDAVRCRVSGAWVEASMQYFAAEHILESQANLPGRTEMLRDVREGIWNCCRVFNPARAITALEALAIHYRNMGMRKEEAYSFIRLINLYSQLGLFGKALHAYEYGLLLCSEDPLLTAAARTAVGYTHTFLGRPLVALELLESARPVLESSDLFLRAINALSTLAATVWKADMKSADAWYSRTKELSADYMDIDLMADMWLAHICCLSGRFEQARRVHDEVSIREKKLGRMAGGLSYLRIQGSIYFRARYFGDIPGARADLARFDVLGSNILGAGYLKELYTAWIALEEGRVCEAHDRAGQALPGLREGFANRVPYALNTLSEARLLMGDAQGASRAALECIEWNEQYGNGDQLIWALRMYAEACVLMGETIPARDALVKAWRLSRASGMKPHQAWILESCGNLFRHEGNVRGAVRYYGASKRIWERMGNAAQARRVEARERFVKQT